MPTLVLQQGHCNRTTGATGTTGEQAFATAVAVAAVALLDRRSGWIVRKILADDPSMQYRGDAFVAVHCDGSISSAARGASVGYRTTEGQQLGQAWKRAYAARGWPGFRQDNYTAALSGYYGTGTAVSQGNRRAVIIECGFLTSPDDRALLNGAGGVERVALAIGDALGIPHNHQEVDMGGEIADKVFTDMQNKLNSLPIGHPVRGKALYDVLLDAEGWGRLANTKLDKMSDDEANVIAAVRQIVADDADAEVVLGQEQFEQLLAALPPVVKEGLRQAFARAGQET